ncbi:MAG: HAMP domain-containing sensor histidine kinase [Solidesulfovibrio sp.]|uniref:sensor histidine kinase n=1 Tax=Solidesulfovibrio sp. TaxID=2910990 RepID=UPI002B209079|nr:HAMP domain-containing sensor histidine kinase [Solidesulfovibrio sp.]MEA4854978.1 HAMP domain-containing sensor histidine kinase [Solidesulfovibrio sp.]
MNAGVVPLFTAKRLSPDKVASQARLFASSPAAGVLDRLPLGVAVCNITRQIVYSNEKFRELTAGDAEAQTLIGQRLGEAFSCLGAGLEVGGCGTSELCRSCGMARALAESLAGGDMAQGECSLARQDGNKLDSLDFRIWIWAMAYGGEMFHAAILTDIRAEKRLLLMERIFYHDILNMVSGMRGICEIMREEKECAHNTEVELLAFAAERVNDLILSQRDFSLAEHGEYEVTPVKMGTLSLLTDVTGLMRREPSARGKELRIDPECLDAYFASDRKLVTRILVNMQKNALEAVKPGQTVTVGCDGDGGHVRFWVNNPGVVPEAARPQIFRRAFSTKGAGRGLGTYGMKLFAENYLEGEVGFTSDADAGTLFFLRLPAAVGLAGK